MAKMITITVKVPENIYKRIERLVDNGFYASKSHLMRRAVIDYLERYHPERERIMA